MFATDVIKKATTQAWWTATIQSFFARLIFLRLLRARRVEQQNEVWFLYFELTMLCSSFLKVLTRSKYFSLSKF